LSFVAAHHLGVHKVFPPSNIVVLHLVSLIVIITVGFQIILKLGHHWGSPKVMTVFRIFRGELKLPWLPDKIGF